jgi:5-(carboxyamino)imidazole ribonucleotide mutase
MSEGPLISVIMGSESDLETMGAARDILLDWGVPFEIGVVSAHRSPERMVDFAKSAEGRGLEVIIAGAGGAAHLPGMVAALTPLPVLGVPVPSKHLSGLDSLLSIAQMPGGVPTATFAIGVAGAKNAAIFAVKILAGHHPRWRERVRAYAVEQLEDALAQDARVRALGRTP